MAFSYSEDIAAAAMALVMLGLSISSARGVGAAPRAGVDKAPMLNLAPATAQDLGSCLPLLMPEMSARHKPWGEGPYAAPALTSAPAGSPGGFGSRGATFREAA